MTTENNIDYSYEKFIGDNVKATEPKTKTLTTVQGKQTYHEVPVQYNYGTQEKPIIDSCFIEFPMVKTRGGIARKQEERKSNEPGDAPYMKESYSMMFIFDLTDPDCRMCLSKLDELHKGVAKAIFPFKTKIGVPFLVPENAQATGLKHPVYYKMDELTNERAAGLNPSIWVKLNHWKNNKTLFTDLNGTPIDWSLLYDVEAKMIPLIHAEKVYCGGGKTSIQMKMVSAVITDIAPINTRSRQTTTLDRLKEKYSGLADAVASQLATLRMEKQDSLDGGDFQPRNAVLPSVQSSATSGSETGKMHQLNGNNQDKLNEFLGAAPVQQSVRPQLKVMSQGTNMQGSTQQGTNMQGTNMQVPQPVQFSQGATMQGSQPVLQIQ